MWNQLRARDEWKFLGILPEADRLLAVAWWAVLGLRGLLPAAFAIAMGALVGAVQAGEPLGLPLTFMGVVFVGLQVLAPVHQAISANLGSRTAAWLYDHLAIACVRPPGMGHLENAELTNDLTMGRDFDLGITGPPLSISMDFIASGLVEMIGGPRVGRRARRVCLVGPAGAGREPGSRPTGCCARAASGSDRNTDEVREAQRHADYAYKLAVDPPAAKELRLFGLAGWTVERFRARRRQLFELRWEATRLRERPVLWSLLLVLGRERVRLRGRWRFVRLRGRQRRPRPARDLRQRCHRHEHDRLRRPLVGARRRGGTGGRRAAPRGLDAGGRRDPHGRR